ncbi:class I SAM-dependent methyltransferase [Paracidovorax citrulli]
MGEEVGRDVGREGQSYEEQAALWNGAAGQGWVAAQDVLDRMFQPMEDLLLQAVAQHAGTRVLDIGCGTGATTIAVARALGSRGQCTGVDLSAPMIDAARRRAQLESSTANFICADAQRYRFQGTGFDMVISRIGVMFFDDPVAAFENLRSAVSDGGSLCFVAWRGASENPFMTAAEQAAAPLLPSLPVRQSDGPGQFAFADADRVKRILVKSGWTDIDVRAVDFPCSFPASALPRYLANVGPVGRVFGELSAETRERVIETVQAAFARYMDGAEVRFSAACWLVAAKAGVAGNHDRLL